MEAGQAFGRLAVQRNQAWASSKSREEDAPREIVMIPEETGFGLTGHFSENGPVPHNAVMRKLLAEIVEGDWGLQDPRINTAKISSGEYDSWTNTLTEEEATIYQDRLAARQAFLAGYGMGMLETGNFTDGPWDTSQVARINSAMEPIVLSKIAESPVVTDQIKQLAKKWALSGRKEPVDLIRGWYDHLNERFFGERGVSEAGWQKEWLIRNAYPFKPSSAFQLRPFSQELNQISQQVGR